MPQGKTNKLLPSVPQHNTHKKAKPLNSQAVAAHSSPHTHKNHPAHAYTNHHLIRTELTFQVLQAPPHPTTQTPHLSSTSTIGYQKANKQKTPTNHPTNNINKDHPKPLPKSKAPKYSKYKKQIG